jgi:hypothetical protein
MLTAAHHNQEALLVVRLYGEPERDDYDRLLEAALTLDRHGAESGKRTAEILLIEDGYPRPDATQRRRIAESAQLLSAERPLFALVTTSSVIRGVLTVLGWLVPPRHEMGAFAGFEEAARWIEERRGQKLPVLRDMFATARDAGRR